MKTRTALVLVIALLVVAALPASAKDNEQDVCDGLRNALEVLDTQAKANQRAIDNVTARAQAADCLDTRFADSRQLCQALGGEFVPGDDDDGLGQISLWVCVNWQSSNLEDFYASEGAFEAACLEDGGVLDQSPLFDGEASSDCLVDSSGF